MSSASGPTVSPATGFAALAAARRAELRGLAYLVAGNQDTADAAVSGAVEEVARTWTGDGDADAALGRCRLGVVRHALVLSEHLDRSQDDDFWRGGAWALQRLPADQRVLVALRVTTDLDDHGLAALLGTPVRLVRRRLEAGRAALRRHLRLPADGTDEELGAALRLVAQRHVGEAAASAAAGAAAVAAAVAEPVVAAAAAPSATGPEPGSGLDPDDPDDATHLTGPLPVARPRSRRVGLLVGAARVVAFGVVAMLAWGLLRGGSGDVVVSASQPPTRTPSAATTSAPPPVTTSAAAVTTRATATATATAKATTRTTTRTTTTRTTARTTPAPTSRTTTSRTTTSTRPPTTTTSKPVVSRTRTPAVPPGLLRNTASGRCVSVPDNPPWGTQLRLADCTGGATQQVSPAAGQALVLVGLCLDDYGFGTSPGTSVVVWVCYQHHPANQQWVLGADGSVRSVHANLCLDAAGNGRAAGTPLVLNPCDGTGSQVWRRT